jgi:hypothetical protein
MAVQHHPDADVPARSVRVHASLPQRERRSRSASIASFVLHGILIYLAIRLTAEVAILDHSPLGDAMLIALGGGGGGGGRGGAVVEHAVTPPAPPPKMVPPVQPPPPPTPTVTPPVAPPVVQPSPPPTAEPPAAGVAAPAGGTGTGTGGGNGSGVGTGTGSGRGPGSGTGSGGGNGDGNRGSPAESKMLAMPDITGVPKPLRGQPIEVTFSIAADGTTVSYVLNPPIADRGFAKKVDEALRAYKFKPARDPDGKPIASSYTITFTWGSK